MIVMGIDPGKKGGVGVLEYDKPVAAMPLPYMAKQVDVKELAALISLYEPDKIAVELQHIMAGQAGAMAIGSNYGRILAVVELAGAPYRIITPATWSKAAGIPRGLSGKAKKEAAYIAAQRAWGKAFAALNLKPTDDGLVEALHIAAMVA